MVKKRKWQFKFRLNLKNLVLWALIIFLALSFLGSLVKLPLPDEEISLSQALTDIKAEKVEKIVVEDNRLILTYQDGQVFISHKEVGTSLTEILTGAGLDPEAVEIRVRDTVLSRAWIDILATVLPLGLVALFFFFIFRQARGTQDTIFSFGRSRARLFGRGRQKVSFTDVGGIEEAKKELEEVVDFLKHPEKYRKVGARTPKGVLLIGPSGTGKTLLAKAVAGQAGVSFFSAAGSEFMEMLVGVGPARIRDLFAQAKKAGRAIVFIDEIDAIGRIRGMGMIGHGEQEQTLNQLLVEMDGFTPADNIIVLAATNKPAMLDPALTRPGRFDRTIVLDLPDIEERKAILKIHARGKPFAKEVDWEKMAKRTVGFSGADLENMLNEAAILTARSGKKRINMDDLEEAATKVKLGPEKKRLQSARERKMTAYHEAGHAVVAHNLPTMDPVHRVSIVSRGLALGFTLPVPEKDKYIETKTELFEKVIALLGGRAAEELKFAEFTGGAASDIDQATRIVRKMVIEYGMSRLGPVFLGPQMEQMEWGRTIVQPSEVSPKMLAKVDEEIKRIVDEGYQGAVKILKKYKAKLDLVAEKLLDQETIEGEEFEKLMK